MSASSESLLLSGSEREHMLEKYELARPRKHRKHGVLGYSLCSLVAGVAIGALSMFVFHNIRGSSTPGTMPQSPIPASVFSPRLPTVMRPDERYVGWSNFVNQNWHYLVQSSESVYILQPEKYNLGPGFSSPVPTSSSSPDRFYHVSNLHQLHCLNILRISYYHAARNISEASADDDAQAAYHAEHCLEYLRQGIMCGDHFGIEGASPPGSPPEEVADAWGNPLGWGITKNCVNWDNLLSWQREELEKASST